MEAWPAGDESLLDWFREGHAALVDALSRAPDDLSCWTFLAAPSPRAFWARRQAHETAIHRADAQSPTASMTPSDTDLAADGVDELLFRFMARPRRLALDRDRSFGTGRARRRPPVAGQAGSERLRGLLAGDAGQGSGCRPARRPKGSRTQTAWSRRRPPTCTTCCGTGGTPRGSTSGATMRSSGSGGNTPGWCGVETTVRRSRSAGDGRRSRRSPVYSVQASGAARGCCCVFERNPGAWRRRMQSRWRAPSWSLCRMPCSGLSWTTDTGCCPTSPARCGCTTSGSCPGDRVLVELSPYDLTRGRIVYRYR